MFWRILYHIICFSLALKQLAACRNHWLLMNLFMYSFYLMFQCFVHLLSGRSKKKDHCLNEKFYPLEETETCPCDEFLSQPYGNWSACILPDPAAPGSLKGWMSHREVKECGQGLRYRAVACIDQQGHLVNPTLCTDSGRTNYKL